MPAFYKCPIWQELCPAVSLKVLVQIPSSNVIPIQVLNDPNDAFQIVSSHITFRGNRGLCFINYNWQQTGVGGGGGEGGGKKNWKVICAALLFFSAAHYGRFCSLIWVSCSLGAKKEALAVSARGVFFFGLEVCHPEFRSKKRAITAECPLLHLHFNAKV